MRAAQPRLVPLSSIPSHLLLPISISTNSVHHGEHTQPPRHGPGQVPLSLLPSPLSFLPFPSLTPSSADTWFLRAILDMKIQRDKLRQYQKKIQAVLDREHQIAKEMVQKGDSARALLALRRRKYQEQLLVKTDGQLQALEELVRVPIPTFFFPFSLPLYILHLLAQG